MTHPSNPEHVSLTVDQRPFLSPAGWRVAIRPSGSPLGRLTRVARAVRPPRQREEAHDSLPKRVLASVRAVRAGVPIGQVFVAGVRLEEQVARGRVWELESEDHTNPPSVRLERHGRVVRVDRNGTRRIPARIHPNGGGTLLYQARAEPGVYIAPGATVSGHAVVRGLARIEDQAVVTGDALVEGAAVIRGRAYVFGLATVSDRAVVGGNAKLGGRARLAGTHVLEGDDRIGDDREADPTEHYGLRT